MASLLSPLLAWGLLARGLGVVYCISHLSISVQILGLCGSAGIQPFSSLLKQIRHDFPSPWSRMWHFPSLFWLVGASDFCLLVVPLAGVACGVAVVLGLFDTRLAFLGCLATLRSLDLPIGLLYPWDSFLFEAGTLAVLLPPVPSLFDGGHAAGITLTSASLSAPLHPWVAASFRWLLCRLLLGFGKKKFVGTSLSHSCYIKNFLVAQPIPSPLGWLGCRLPLPLFQAALVVMFFVECVAPLFLLPAGLGRGTAALLIVALMLGIQAGGNFGHFNVLTSVVCLGCLDTTSSVFDALPPLDGGEAGLRAFLAVHTALSLLFFLFDSWCTNAFAYWPQLAIARRAWVRGLLRLCRVFADHRLLHAYGVFPPGSNPPIRMAPVLEGSHDGKAWRRYEWKYLPCSPTSRPAFVAPHHPRLDHSLFYVSFGTGPDNFLSTINSARPYGFCKDSMLHRVGHALLSGASPAVRRLFRVDPFPPDAPPPRMVRVLLMGYEPLPLGECRDGKRWKEVCLDVHLPPIALAGDGLAQVEPEPERKGRESRAAPATIGTAARTSSARRRRSTSKDRLGASRDAASAVGGASAPPEAFASPGVAIPPIPAPLTAGARDPLLFHPDLMPIWRTRSPKLRAILSAPLDPWGATAHQVSWLSVRAYGEAEGSSPHSAADLVSQFWSSFVPCVRDILSAAPSPVPAGRPPPDLPYSAEQLHGFELILGGLTMRMMLALEHLHLARRLPLLGGAAPTYFHLVLLAHAMILRGATAASTLLVPIDNLADEKVCAQLEVAKIDARTAFHEGFAFYGLLWTDQLIFHARKWHVAYQMMRRYNEEEEAKPAHPCLIPGFLFVMRELAELPELREHVTANQRFPRWKPPEPLGDWKRL